SRWTAGSRLCRGPELGDRVSLGGGPKRSLAGAGSRIGSSAGERHCRDEHSCGARGTDGNHHDSNRVLRRSGPGPTWSGHQPQPTGRQSHGRGHLKRGGSREAAGPASTALAETITRELEAAARTLGLELHVLHASSESEIDAAFATLVQLRAGALVIGADALFNSRSEQLAALTIRHRVPAIYQFREFVSAGGLMAYGSTVLDTYHP